MQFEEPNCPPLKTRGIHLVIPIGLGGFGCTSSPLPREWRYKRFEYVYPDGTRTEIPQRSLSRPGQIWGEGTSWKTWIFFIGTEEEFNGDSMQTERYREIIRRIR